MNYSTAIFLVNSAVRAVSVSYEPDTNDATGKRGKGPFVTFKTIDAAIQPGEFVTIPTDTRWKMTVARIEEVDLDVDFDSSVEFKWLIGHISTDAYEAILKQEADAISKIRSAEKRRKQDELKEKLLADNPDLQALVNVSNGSALPAPAEPPVYEAPPHAPFIPSDDPF